MSNRTSTVKELRKMNVMSKIVDVENERPQVIWATGYAGFKPVKLPDANFFQTAINLHRCILNRTLLCGVYPFYGK